MTAKKYLPNSFEGWEIIPGYIEQTHVATAILKGNEIHLVSSQSIAKNLFRENAQENTSTLLERKSFLTTRVVLKDLVKQKFVERLGFKPT